MGMVDHHGWICGGGDKDDRTAIHLIRRYIMYIVTLVFLRPIYLPESMNLQVIDENTHPSEAIIISLVNSKALLVDHWVWRCPIPLHLD